MLLSQLLEANKKTKVVVVYGGRFQPFHKGHYTAYKHLCKDFGKDNVWIATSDKRNLDSKDGSVSPFSFKEKKEIITALYGIPSRRIIEAKNPTFKPSEVFKMYKDYSIVYVSAVGAKDESRYHGGDFFKPLPDKERDYKTMDDGVGYYTVMPIHKNISGTQVRAAFKDIKGDVELEEIFNKYFGEYDSTIAQLIQARLKEVK